MFCQFRRDEFTTSMCSTIDQVNKRPFVYVSSFTIQKTPSSKSDFFGIIKFFSKKKAQIDKNNYRVIFFNLTCTNVNYPAKTLLDYSKITFRSKEQFTLTVFSWKPFSYLPSLLRDGLIESGTYQSWRKGTYLKLDGTDNCRFIYVISFN